MKDFRYMLNLLDRFSFYHTSTNVCCALLPACGEKWWCTRSLLKIWYFMLIWKQYLVLKGKTWFLDLLCWVTLIVRVLNVYSTSSHSNRTTTTHRLQWPTDLQLLPPLIQATTSNNISHLYSYQRDCFLLGFFSKSHFWGNFLGAFVIILGHLVSHLLIQFYKRCLVTLIKRQNNGVF